MLDYDELRGMASDVMTLLGAPDLRRSYVWLTSVLLLGRHGEAGFLNLKLWPAQLNVDEPLSIVLRQRKLAHEHMQDFIDYINRISVCHFSAIAAIRDPEVDSWQSQAPDKPTQGSPMAEAPCPPRPAAIFAPASFVDSVLPQQCDRAREEPDCLFFKCRWRDWLSLSQVVCWLLKPL